MSNTMSVADAHLSLKLPPQSPTTEIPPSAVKWRPPKPPKPNTTTTSKLCDRCSTLGLSADKFLIVDNRSADSKPSMTSLRLANERFILGTLAEIKYRAPDCRLCGLIACALPDAPPPQTEDAHCYLIWEIDGRIWTVDESIGQETEASKRTRRLRVSWDHADLQQCESYLVLAAPSAYNNSDVDYRGLLNDETEFLGRRLGKSENKKNLIRELLRLCERLHDDRCTSKLGIEDDFHETLKEPYFGVIDIQNDNLVPLPFEEYHDQLRFEPYAAVSYVWGDTASQKHTTKICNIQRRRKSGGLASVIHELPKALKETIQLVHALGIRYIWIDALCIVQDSSHSWNLNARAMHLIYGNALFTICAADGNDTDTGLLALDTTHQPDPWIKECGDGLKLLLHQPPEISIEVSQWNKRAWTFQERLLSKRCVIFAGGRIYFQCRSTSMSEDIFANRNGRGWSLDLLSSPLQMLSQLKLRALWFYTRCVSLYTKRDLSEPFDILSAFSGMCKLMEYTMHAPFSFGLPTSHFDFALLWEPKNNASRLLRPKRTNDAKYKDTKFPSWSWCGWESDGISYSPDMVDGCLSDVHAWLLGRTWIDWHIRDGHGTLRRVWDRSSFQGDESTNPKWKGYEPRSRASSQPVIPPLTKDHPYQQQVIRRPGLSQGLSERVAIGDAPLIQNQRPRHKMPEIQPISRHTNAPTTTMYRTEANTIMTNGNHATDTQEGPQALRRRVNNITTNDNYDPNLGLTAETSWPDYRSDYSNDVMDLEIGCDAYGRPLSGNIASTTTNLPKVDFTLTLPEDPYHVRKTKTHKGTALSREFPDQIYLQFFTWKTNFYIVPTAIDESSLSPAEEGSESGICRCHIMDRRGDKCGSIVIDVEWFRQKKLIEDGTGQLNDSAESTKFEFIAISEAKTFSKDEFPDWTYYIPKEREESEWDLFFVLLVEYFPVEGFYQRVALGKAFKAAFSLSDNEWEEIILG